MECKLEGFPGADLTNSEVWLSVRCLWVLQKPHTGTGGVRLVLLAHLALESFPVQIAPASIALSIHVRKAFSVFEPGLRCVYL